MADTILLKSVRFDWIEPLWTAKKFSEKAEPKHSVCVVIAKNHPQVQELRDARKRIADEVFPIAKRSKKDEIQWDLRDGDDPKEEKGESYKGCYFFNATATTEYPPQIIDGAKRTLKEKGQWKNGDYGNVLLTLKSFNVGDNKGATSYVDVVQFVRVGDALGRDNLGRFEVEEDTAPDGEY